MVSKLLFSHERELDAELLSKASSGKPLRPVLVGAHSREALQTAISASDLGIAEPVLVGERVGYLKIAEMLNLAPERFEFIDTESESETILAATRLVHAGKANCLVKGQIHTDIYMQGILNRTHGLRVEGGSWIVHVFAMIPPGGGRPLFISDGAVNPQPSQEILQQSIRSCVSLAQAWGIMRPKVAILSATESILARVPSSEQASRLVSWAQDQDFDADFAGPLALDGAISPKAAQIKGLNNAVAGNADILIVPDIVSGNILFKSAVYFAGALAAGLVLGARVPVVLTSRADPPEARLASIALAKLALG